MNLANKLTIFRIVLIPVYLIFLTVDISSVDHIIATAVFVIASVTDLFDGKIARKRNLVTDFGKFADPLADKLLTCSAFIFFVQLGLMPAWVCTVLIAREIAVSGFRLVLAAKGHVLAAAFSGKFKTAIQMIYICIATLNGAPLFNHLGLPDGFLGFYNIFTIALMYLSLVLSVVSMGEMFYKNRKDFSTR